MTYRISLKAALLVLTLLPVLSVPAAPFLATAALAESGSGKNGDGGGGRGGDSGGDRDDDRDDREDDRDDDRDDREDDREDREDDREEDRDDQDGAASGNPASGGGGASGDHGRILRIEIRGGSIEVRYADGSRERISNGRYEFQDARGRTERHTATGADIARLKKIARDARAVPAAAEGQQNARVERYEMRPGGIALFYSNGWTEAVERGVYLLADPFGRAITRRKATQGDLDRLVALAGGR